MASPLYTVEAAAERLKLHPKTVLRFIREGRLPAAKVGRGYRIQGSHLEAFAGVELTESDMDPRVTAVLDIPDVDAALLQRLTAAMLGAGGGRRRRTESLTIDVAHDPILRKVKVIAIGGPRDVSAILEIAAACVEA